VEVVGEVRFEDRPQLLGARVAQGDLVEQPVGQLGERGESAASACTVCQSSTSSARGL
jgi:hypothetical protein